MHPIFRLSSLWLSSVLGLNQTRLFILFAHFLPLLLRVFLHSIPAASADQEEGHVAAYSLVKTMPCRRRRSPHSVPSPPLDPSLFAQPDSDSLLSRSSCRTRTPRPPQPPQRTTSSATAHRLRGRDRRMDFALLLLGPPASRPSSRLPSPLLSSPLGAAARWIISAPHLHIIIAAYRSC